MGPFKTRLRKGATWLLLVAAALWPYVWAFIKWVAETVATEWVTSRFQPWWDALPDAPIVLAAVVLWSQQNPVGTALLIAAAVVVVTFVWALIDTLRNTRPEPKTDEQQRAPQQSRISVEPYGGKDATLVIRNNGQQARMTGSGQFLIEKSEMPITRRRPYRLVWQQPIGWTDFDNIGAGHFGTVILAAGTVNASRDDVHLAMLGDGGGVEAWNHKLVDVGHGHWQFQDLRTIQIRVSLQADPPLAEAFERVYVVSWDGGTEQFAVEEVAA